MKEIASKIGSHFGGIVAVIGLAGSILVYSETKFGSKEAQTQLDEAITAERATREGDMREIRRRLDDQSDMLTDIWKALR